MVAENGLLVCGNVNIDRIYSVSKLPSEGQSTPITTERVVFGGCGGNISVAAARMGVDVVLSTVIGKDFPHGYMKALEVAGVDISEMAVSEELPSPYCIILSAPEGKQVYAFNTGSMAEQKYMDTPLERIMRYSHIATSDPGFSIRAARELRNAGSSVSIDPGMEIFFRWDRDELKEVLDCCDRFFGNLGEWKHLGEVLGWKKRGPEVLEGYVPYFPEAFELIGEAVVTLGSNGSVLLTGNDFHYEGPLKVDDVVDATGAGDAFRGGFYAALLNDYDVKDALRFGNALGAVSVSGEGPQNYTTSLEALLHILEK
jgi:sugar/nucleoside kinase (ribokinase family)